MPPLYNLISFSGSAGKAKTLDEKQEVDFLCSPGVDGGDPKYPKKPEL
jgi:hypothetical protein